MAEYIKREAAINDIIKIIRKSDMPEDWSKGMLAAMSTLYRIPAADVRPVVRGKWISDHPGTNFGKEVRLDKDGCPVSTCHCSECGEWLTASDEYPVKGRFCPNCGADMREES